MRVQRYRSIIPESIYVQSERLGLGHEFPTCQLLYSLWFQKSTMHMNAPLHLLHVSQIYLSSLEIDFFFYLSSLEIDFF